MNKCKRCGHGWESRMKRAPASCPACKSYKWNEEPSRVRQEKVSYEETDRDRLDAELRALDGVSIESEAGTDGAEVIDQGSGGAFRDVALDVRPGGER